MRFKPRQPRKSNSQWIPKLERTDRSREKPSASADVEQSSSTPRHVNPQGSKVTPQRPARSLIRFPSCLGSCGDLTQIKIEGEPGAPQRSCGEPTDVTGSTTGRFWPLSARGQRPIPSPSTRRLSLQSMGGSPVAWVSVKHARGGEKWHRINDHYPGVAF